MSEPEPELAVESELDSLPSSPTSTGSNVSDEDARESDAEREWHESLQQLELLLTLVLVPYAGKYFGRKCAYWCMSPSLNLFPLFSGPAGLRANEEWF